MNVIKKHSYLTFRFIIIIKDVSFLMNVMIFENAFKIIAFPPLGSV
jgi:hypothetical protein